MSTLHDLTPPNTQSAKPEWRSNTAETSKKAMSAGFIRTLPFMAGFFILVAILCSAYYFYQHINDPAYPEIIITSPENIPAASPPVAEEQPAEPAPEPEPISEPSEEQTIALINPNAPCSGNQFSCVRISSDTTKDPGCPDYKPIWAYFSDDKGASWKRVGCYATEIDANKALVTAKTNAAKPKKLSESIAANKPAMDNKPIDQPHVAAVQTQDQPTHNHSPATDGEVFEAKFKGAFGLTVEKRNYRSADMKQKALALWDKERKLLEPDGSINEKYVVKPQSTGSTGIPGY